MCLLKSKASPNEIKDEEVVPEDAAEVATGRETDIAVAVEVAAEEEEEAQTTEDPRFLRPTTTASLPSHSQPGRK